MCRDPLATPPTRSASDESIRLTARDERRALRCGCAGCAGTARRSEEECRSLLLLSEWIFLWALVDANASHEGGAAKVRSAVATDAWQAGFLQPDIAGLRLTLSEGSR